MPHSRRLRAAFGSALPLLAMALFGPSALAQQVHEGGAASPEPALRMTWESEDPECSGDDVGARAMRLVTPGVVPHPLRARVEVRREAEQWLVRLQTESGDAVGRRILRAESCAELQQAIALLLAMTLESKGVLPELPAESPERPALPPASADQPASSAPPPVAQPSMSAPTDPEMLDESPPVVAPERERTGLGWFARVDGKAAWGLQPGLGFGLGVAAGIRIGDLDIGAAGAFWPETQTSVLDRDGRVSVTRQNVGLRACWNVWRIGGLVLAPCLAPELTFFRYVSENVIETRRGTAGPLPSLSGGVDLRYELIDRRLSLLLAPGVTWERPQPFEIRLGGGPAADEEIAEVYETRGFGPRLEVGVDARF